MKLKIIHLIIEEEPLDLSIYKYWGTSACGKTNVPGEVSPLIEGYMPINWKLITCKSCINSNIYKEIKFKHELGLGV